MTNAEKELMLREIGRFVAERTAHLEKRIAALEAQLEERKLHVVKRA